MLSENTISIIKTITPLVAANAETITRRFYQIMFEGDPQVKTFFNMAHQESGQQPKALAEAVCAYFANIENLGVLGPTVELIAQKHCSLNIQPEHYPIVGKYLLIAIKDVMGDAATDEIINAVAEAYEFLANVCINRETEIYQQHRAMTGGWLGYRKFIVWRKEEESQEITSFYLQPKDSQPLPNFKPGQYITIQVDDPNLSSTPRNYSLSDSPNQDYFRISVKKELGKTPNAPNGMISSYLHDEVQVGGTLSVGAPCGEFTLDPAKLNDQPVVFLAGGVGITPLLSMAKTLVDQAVLAPIYFIHASRNSAVHAFDNEVCKMISDKDFVNTLFVYDDPLAADLEDGKCDSVGYVTADVLRDKTPYQSANFYVCGPTEFMHQMLTILDELDVEPARIHYEFFGPKQDFKTLASA
ncbi:MAG: NO-inducible flavohemoprotein [Planctomycetaceae bacterium]|nr:NO-inducible flavohemoprotein [Planctomycetaceae bacterium]MCP4463895.1 NO-inducible flavohemoprotein [Planctomycetaceae bacterium]MDG1807499.1 NO-inducible flavohemoprotein [Pirellulaceae bacterium]MDG2104133.1 NO-inducible flavohemoprotein [Pirellulaceae bacterium]